MNYVLGVLAALVLLFFGTTLYEHQRVDTVLAQGQAQVSACNAAADTRAAAISSNAALTEEADLKRANVAETNLQALRAQEQATRGQADTLLASQLAALTTTPAAQDGPVAPVLEALFP
ncbi:MAG: hypothetical protein P4N59_11460 [Negativicutes bacterium]|nr:hypothetical protein [Negativicutes bacterium]